MSTLDNDDDQIAKEPLTKSGDGEKINATQNVTQNQTQGRDYSSIIDKDQMRRKKYIKWGIIGGIALIALILAIVLPLTLKSDGGGGNPDTPVIPKHYNPYKVDDKDIKLTG